MRPRCGARPNPSFREELSGKFLDGVAVADHTALQHATQHAPAPPQLFAKAWANGLHLIARSANRADFQTCLADAQELANLQAIQDRKSTRLNSSHRCIS